MVNTRLNEMGITLSLSEVKGPVMDRLKHGDFSKHLTGQVYPSQFDAYRPLCSVE
jgi:SulP family sulfate permease